jgi:protein TonB
MDSVLSIERSRHLVLAIGMSLGAHGWLCLHALPIDRSVDPSAERTHRRDIELSLAVVDVEPVEPSVPPHRQRLNEARTTPPAKRAVHPKPRDAPPSPTLTASPPAPSQPVLAQMADVSIPVDLTSETLVTGTADANAAGMATSSGADTAGDRVHDAALRSSPRGQGAAPNGSRAVSLGSQAWSCPWPVEADADRIDEQTVVIRVLVDALGNAESVTVVMDPGHGFGSAATSCAMRTRFTPAHDPQGKPIRAQSPPIRVRFTR